ncbi:MAG: hypothetical protein Q8Q49_00570 [bacterium]|nr:hypothetical protein [bacterium]
MNSQLELKQKQLQSEASELLDYLGLLRFLSRFGKPEIVGSLVTGLMTWPDIDIELVKPINENNFWKTAKFLLHQPDFKRVLVMDFRKSGNPNTPKGLHICVKDLSWKEKTWKIDIWFLPPRKKNEPNFHLWLEKHLKPEHKLPIMKIKTEIASHPKYRSEIFSTDIYEAVIMHRVRNMEGFKEYLIKSGRSLDLG